MISAVASLSKYVFIILIAMYTLLNFTLLSRKAGNGGGGWALQNVIMFVFHLLAFLVIFINTWDVDVLVLGLIQIFVLQAALVFTRLFYPKINRVVLGDMCMLLDIGFVVLTRLSYDKSVRQLMIAAAALAVSLIVPVIIRKCAFLSRIQWVYLALGLLLLVAVWIFGESSSGAKLTLTIGSFSFQPSEFVKIIFVFYVAASLARSTQFKDVAFTTALAAVHVLILVVSTDLGAALLFFVTYLVMLYVATRKKLYLLAGAAAGVLSAAAGYMLFSHVRVRVTAWLNPFAENVIENEGYQTAQSLFAISTGGWFGMGLYEGSPEKIPVVEQDFVFSAIAEEFGGIFAICLILLCLSCFIMFINIAMKINEDFYKFAALGLGTMYGFQVFLTVGGAIRFIPSTGVTLPLISYGGSSVVVSIMMFAIIQGMYLLKGDEDLKIEEERRLGRTESGGGKAVRKGKKGAKAPEKEEA